VVGDVLVAQMVVVQWVGGDVNNDHTSYDLKMDGVRLYDPF
jgi:hypothetical protein